MPYTRLSLVLAALIGAHALPAAEHAAPPPPPPPEELFKAFDKDSSGSLSREEFANGLRELAQHRQERRPGGAEGGDRPPRPGGADGGDRPPRPGGNEGGDRPPRPGGADGGDHPPRPGGAAGGDQRPPRPVGQRPPPPPPEGGDGDSQRRPPPPGDGQQPPLDPAERERRVNEAFNAGDTDKDGALTPPEFKAAMEAMPKPPRPPGRPPQDRPKQQ